MKILLTATARPPHYAEVPNKEDRRPGNNWVNAAIDASWTWCRYTGAESVTATEEDGTRIATVSLVIHDE